MARASRAAQRFVRALIGGEAAVAAADMVRAGAVELPALAARELIAAGILGADLRPLREARSWLRRQLVEDDAFAAQHRTEVVAADGARLNLDESPLARLGSGPQPYLARHQVEAGERIRRLCERARLQPRLTMSYSAAHVAGSGPAAASDVSDMAAEARRELAQVHRRLPGDCAGVVLDVCGLLKGLQQVESERGWPRRSAKLVLRIGLEQAARHFGLSPLAEGSASGRQRSWIGEGARPTVVG